MELTEVQKQQLEWRKEHVHRMAYKLKFGEMEWEPFRQQYVFTDFRLKVRRKTLLLHKAEIEKRMGINTRYQNAVVNGTTKNHKLDVQLHHLNQLVSIALRAIQLVHGYHKGKKYREVEAVSNAKHYGYRELLDEQCQSHLLMALNVPLESYSASLHKRDKVKLVVQRFKEWSKEFWKRPSL